MTIKDLVEKYGQETVVLMKTQLLDMKKEHTRLYQDWFHPTLLADVESVIWEMELPGYAEIVDEGRKPGQSPQPVISELQSWATRLNLPYDGGKYTERTFPYFVRGLVLKEGIDPVNYFHYFLDVDRVNKLSQDLYLIVEQDLEKSLVKIIKEVQK